MACHVDHEELERRARMWAQGMSVKEMAAECFVTAKTMESYVCRHRKYFPRRYTPSTMDERKRARAMRAEGMTYRAIAETLGRKKRTVWQWCNGADMTGNKFCPTCGVKFVGNGPSK